MTRGLGLLFNLREREQNEDIQVTFEAVYVETSDSLRAEVSFSR